MIPDPKFGEIEIRGERWRWVTVEHYPDPASTGGVTEPRMRWSVSFRDPDDPDRGFWCDVPERKAQHLTDRELRELFEVARAGVEG
ncbi:MAG: hypothetical protein GWM92_03800, partial [Gemmatimonadetes bacterium]|nr:hypothetical protein [Gemmatimonadota bacterium]NIR77663.1 hypothetical protein [Gemmatimonadota bacterium]NIT86205.1 hypothetical protein [Gemmatimonadota bacterium]NIU30030.1 hypothetical protein [Gemmatimonadota bacterium]NIU34989.1 hypothetical protein [Gemmatimonadota bacterium]